MGAVTNLLSEDTSTLASGLGGWVSFSNAILDRSLRSSPFATRWRDVVSGIEVYENSLQATASAAGDVVVNTEQAAAAPGLQYKAWVAYKAESVARTTTIELVFFDTDGASLVPEEDSAFSWSGSTTWAAGYAAATAPNNTARVALYLSVAGASAGEVYHFTRASIIESSTFLSPTTRLLSDALPDYLVSEDRRATDEGQSVSSPLRRFMDVATAPLDDFASRVKDWDLLRSVNTIDNQASLSTLTDASTAEIVWLPWLAQLVGVTLTTRGGGSTPWSAFDSLADWDAWEDDINPGPNDPDTRWVDIEGYAVNYFEKGAAYRRQIITGFNGVKAGTESSITSYIRGLLNTNEPSPFVGYRKHYRTNPWLGHVVVAPDVDPDPDGTLLVDAAQSAAPAGITMSVGYGVGGLALVKVTVSDFISALSNDTANYPTDDVYRLPLSMIEDQSGRGANWVSGYYQTVSYDAQELGSGVAPARYFSGGHALYAGSVEAVAATSPNQVGDQELWFLLSDLQGSNTESPTKRILLTQPGKFTLSVNDGGTVTYDWVDDSSTSQTATSTVAVPYGNPHPWWLRVVLTDDGSGGTDIDFSWTYSPWSGWTAIGNTVNVGSTNGMASATTSFQIFDDNTASPETASAVAYRVLLFDGTTGGAASAMGSADLDLNFLGEQADNHTGTLAIASPLMSHAITISQPVEGTNWYLGEWVVCPHTGTDYFHFGHSPFSHHGGTASLGDTLAVDMESSDTYYWTINYLDGTNTQGSETTQTITWDSDDYGGTAITSIVVKTTSHAGTTVGEFLPSIVVGPTVQADDSYGKQWTLTRSYDESDYYEFSSTVDRPLLKSYAGQASSYPLGDEPFATNETEASVAMVYRRYHSTSTGVTHLFRGLGAYGGFLLQIFKENFRVQMWDTQSIKLSNWDEVAAGRIGEVNLVVFRYDPSTQTAELVVNGVVEVTEDYSTLIPWQSAVPISWGHVETQNRRDIEWMGLYVFDHFVSDAEVALLMDEFEIT